ncbi:M24 family metallopeptidase [Cryptosporangium sp. NPDC051539]|uniref:M24 family metallopeptidase n=1 Tax=Cryptosporangium sp. NPDC051539 TaxID=3363962 RepID=UPI0037ABD7D7
MTDRNTTVEAVGVGDGWHTARRRDATPAFTPQEYADRLRGVQDDMARAGLDILLVHTPENICYLSGYETSGYFEYQVMVVPVAGEPTMLVRNVEQLNVDEHTWLPGAYVWRDGTDYLRATVDLVEAIAAGARVRVALEKHSWFVTAQVAGALEAGLDRHRLVDAGHLVETRRLVKSPAEQQLIRESARIADASMAAALGVAAAGRTEREVAAAAHHANILAGGEYPALPHYVSSGARSEVGHATWSDKILEPGDLIKLEFLGVRRRYHAGITRAVSVGRAGASVRERAAVALNLQEEVFADLRPGAATHDVTVRARRSLAGRGLAPIKLRLGYSMGIGFPPIAGEGKTADFREGSPVTLAAGMTFHMLAVVGLDMTFSDTVLITPAGFERLTGTARELLEV